MNGIFKPEAVSSSAIIAHLDEQQRIQTVAEHCHNVADMAKSFAPPFLAEAAYQCGLYHDTGKCSQEFQQYIRGIRRSRVDHSTAGAQLLIRQRTTSSLYEAFCIAGHHAGLPDGGTQADNPQDGTFCARMKKKIPDYARYHDEIGEPVLVRDNQTLKDIQGDKDAITESLVVRMLFSSLVDADFLDTERFVEGKEIRTKYYDSMDQLYDKFFDMLTQKGFFDPHSSINVKRTAILRESIEGAGYKPGLFTMTVPTGGGKTISAFAFAMEHAKRYHKKRIIYVIPYTSIIEQTVEVLQSLLGKENVLAHHSQVDYDDVSETMVQQRLATENWDAPVIVTTNVQFLESLFSNKSSRCRKLHNIADSVILMDEAQMLPIPYLSPILACIKSLVKWFSCSVLLCSATQPHLERYISGVPFRELISNIPELYDFFKRTTFTDEGRLEYDEVAAAVEQREQVLCICLTKKEAWEIYNRVHGPCIYLSTELCPKHRSQVIGKVKKLLREKKPCKVISTSIISVGVDIDFPEVFLEQTGLDSLIQGAGRCNREGRNTCEESQVHIFRTEASEISRFLRKERQCTDLTIHYHRNLASPEAIQYYFQTLYQNNEQGMDKQNILKLSGTFQFKTIEDRFQIIEDRTKALFIPLDEEAKQIEQQLRLGVRNRELMRKAGKYIISVWSTVSLEQPGLYEQLLNEGFAEKLDPELAVLRDLSLYHPVTGFHYKKEEGRGLFV
jgi:CRISPR-associated endonuclease/helicase Cas3